MVIYPGIGNVKIPPINLYNASMVSALLLWYASCFDEEQ